MTTPEFERTFYIRDYQAAQTMKLLHWGVGVVAVGVLGLTSQLDGYGPKWLGSAAGLAASLFAASAAQVQSASAARARDIEDVSDQMLNQQLFMEQQAPIDPVEKLKYNSVLEAKRIAAAAPKALPATTQVVFKPATIELDDILKRMPDGTAKYPHVLILGSTGSGKTLLAEYLADMERNQYHARTIYCSPTVGQDYNNGAMEFLGAEMAGCGWWIDGNEELNPISNRYDEISTFISSLSKEVGLRANTPASVKRGYGFINAFLDESITQMKNTQCVGYNGETMSVGAAVANLAGIARKQMVRMFVVILADTVAAMDLKGMGDLRENYTYIYLGEFAKEHFSSVYCQDPETASAARTYWERMKVKYGRLLAMIDDSICILPDLSQYRETKMEVEYDLLMGPSLSVQPMPAVEAHRRTGPTRPPRVATKPPEQVPPVDNPLPSVPLVELDTLQAEVVPQNQDIHVTHAHSRYSDMIPVKLTGQAKWSMRKIWGDSADEFHLYDLFDMMVEDGMTGPRIKRMLGYDDNAGKQHWENYVRVQQTGNGELQTEDPTPEGY